MNVRAGARYLWVLMELGAVALIAAGTALVLAAGPGTARGTALVSAADAQPSAREVRVYFSKRTESDADFTVVFPVTRMAPDAGVAAASLRALIAGPTPEEAAEGYFSELGTMLVGPSDCGDADFSIRIDAGVATVRSCRTVSSAGIGQDARVMSALHATLRQFPTIQRTRFLTPDGDCLFDMSGENRCLADPR